MRYIYKRWDISVCCSVCSILLCKTQRTHTDAMEDSAYSYGCYGRLSVLIRMVWKDRMRRISFHMDPCLSIWIHVSFHMDPCLSIWDVSHPVLPYAKTWIHMERHRTEGQTLKTLHSVSVIKDSQKTPLSVCHQVHSKDLLKCLSSLQVSFLTPLARKESIVMLSSLQLQQVFWVYWMTDLLKLEWGKERLVEVGVRKDTQKTCWSVFPHSKCLSSLHLRGRKRSSCKSCLPVDFLSHIVSFIGLFCKRDL